MKLLASTTSPFVRKVLVVASELELRDQIDATYIVTSPLAPHADLVAANPLGKLPTLILPDGSALFDSRVICGFLCEEARRRTTRTNLQGTFAEERFGIERLHALADGLLDAGISIRYEQVLRPSELQYSSWLVGQSKKVHDTLAWVEARPHLISNQLDLGTIALACALSWFEFRNPVPDLRNGYPTLFAWYDTFRQRPSMVQNPLTAS
jgi:glutathione S-transferase